GARECHSFLDGPETVTSLVPVEVDMLNMGPDGLVFQHPFGTVSERQHPKSFTSRFDTGSHLVHFIIAEFGRKMLFCPAVHDACTVDAKQDSGPDTFRPVIDMSEGVDSRFLIVHKLVTHAVDYSGGSCGCGHFSGLQYIKRQRVVRLIARFIGNLDVLA